MNDRQTEPREYDLVLGGNNPPPKDGLVLGGIEGVKRRLASEDVEVRIAALKDAIAFGDKGLNLVISALEDKSKLVQSKAYLILKECSNIKSQKAIESYNDWLFFRCLKKITYYGEPCSVNCMVVSSDEKTLFTGSRDTIKMWDVETGTLIYSRNAQSEFITSLAISPDDKLLASGSSNHKIKLWNIKDRKITNIQILQEKRSGKIIFLAFSPDGNTLFSAMPFYNIQIWDWKSKVSKNYQGDTWAIQACTISLDKYTLVSGKHLINIRDIMTEEIKYSLQSPREISVIAISPDKNVLATTDENRPSNSSINIWNITTGNIEKTLYGHSHYIKFLVFSPDGKTLISGSQDGTSKIWDLKTGNLIKTLEGHTSTVTSLIVTHDGQKIISGSLDSSIRIWGIE